MTNLVAEETIFQSLVRFSVLPYSGIDQFPVGNATPSVKNLENWVAVNIAPVTITNFINGAIGQKLHILGDGFTTIASNANIVTNTKSNKLLLAQKIYTFYYINNVWYEEQDKYGILFDVTDYGAKNDNFFTNNTAAFALTAAAVLANGGGIFYIPTGNFLADPPALISNLVVRGDGIGRSNVRNFSAVGTWHGTDISNVTLEYFSNQGKSNAGVTVTNQAVFIVSTNFDVENIKVQYCEFFDYKTEAVVRVGGNGDLVTPATKFAKNIHIDENKIHDYYDKDPTNLGQIASAIYVFGGFQDCWIKTNNVDGFYGKSGVIVQTEGTNLFIEENKIARCGQLNSPPGAYGIAVYSSYVAAYISVVSVQKNILNFTYKAGLYFSSVNTVNCSVNTLVKCDFGGSGLGSVGSGAIQFSAGNGDPSNGPSVIDGNIIIDPGKIGLYINNYHFNKAETTATGNTIKAINPAAATFGVVLHGWGIVLNSNSIYNFQTSIFLYTTADNDLGEITISGGQIDGTNAVGAATGITWNTLSVIGPLHINNIRFKNLTTGVDIRNVTDIDFSHNTFTGVNTCAIINAVRATIGDNKTTDGGATGLNITLLAATATAKAKIHDNLFSLSVNPLVLTENAGQATLSNNDFGTQAGISADMGDANIATALNQPTFELFHWSTTLTANRTATQAGTKCYRGDKRRYLRDAAVPGAFTLAVIDGVSGLTRYTIPANQKGFVDMEFDGTNWQLAGASLF